MKIQLAACLLHSERSCPVLGTWPDLHHLTPAAQIQRINSSKNSRFFDAEDFYSTNKYLLISLRINKTDKTGLFCHRAPVRSCPCCILSRYRLLHNQRMIPCWKEEKRTALPPQLDRLRFCMEKTKAQTSEPWVWLLYCALEKQMSPPQNLWKRPRSTCINNARRKRKKK